MIEICAERGYQETTVGEVLARAEVSRSSFEALFSGKEDCAVAALRKISSEVLSAAGPGQQPGTGLPGGGLPAARTLVELMAARPGYAYFSYVEARQGGSARMHEVYESLARVLSAIAERARGSGPGSAVPARAVRAALGGAEAVVRAEIAAGRLERLPRLAPDLLYGVLVPLSGRREALRQRQRLAAQIAGGG